MQESLLSLVFMHVAVDGFQLVPGRVRLLLALEIPRDAKRGQPMAAGRAGMEHRVRARISVGPAAD